MMTISGVLKMRQASGSAIIVAVLAGSAVPVLAQSQPQQTEAPAAASALTDEIIVTARRRAEPLQRVPVAVTAFSEGRLAQQQVDDVNDLNAVIPSLSITNITGSAVAQIYLRGAGQDDSHAASEPPITVYVDDVPYTKAPGQLLDIIELERVEVLRGPQGTLYGRNSTGGAIKFITKRPSLTDTRFVGDLTVGSYRRADLRGSFTTPLSDSFGVRVDAVSRNENGFVRDALRAANNSRPARYNDTRRQVLRLSALWQPSTETSVYGAFDYTNDDGGPVTGVPAIASTPAANLVNNQIVQARPVYGTLLAAPTLSQDQRFKGRGALLNVEHDSGGVQLNAIFGYRGFDLSQGSDTDGGPNVTSLSQTGASVTRGFGFDFVRDWSNDTLTLELKASGGERLKWVAGAFGLRERNESTDIFGRFSEPAAPQSASLFVFDQTTKSISVFGEGSFALTPRLNLSAGARYTSDNKDLDRSHAATLGRPVLSGAPYVASTSKTWSKLTPRVILDWEPSDDVKLYASWSRGFQAGAYQSFPFSLPTANQPFNPTTVDSYEAGLKSSFVGGALVANVAAFRADYKDLPSSIIGGIGAITVLTNDVRLQGIELELRARPTRGLDVYLIGGITDDKFLRSVVAVSAVPGMTANRLKFVPKASARVGVSYTAELANASKLIATTNVTYSGDYYMSTVNTPFAYQPDYTLVGTELTYEAPGGGWALSVGGRNLTDNLYQERSSTGGGGVITYGQPRTWYSRLRIRI
jgi:iron complex outermembrane recepter protein